MQFAKGVARVDAVQMWHVEVEENDINVVLLAGKVLQRLCRAVLGVDNAAALFQGVLDHGHMDGVIVNDQNTERLVAGRLRDRAT